VSEYEGREQSLVKHIVLRKYLGRFAHIIFSWKPAITYVDCFSGPWQVKTADFSDSSFAIALDEMRKARETWRQKRPNRQIRCFFLEKDKKAYRKLQAFAQSVQDAEIATKNAKLEDAVNDILDFVDKGGPDSFPFFLIDPTGWTGFELDVIEPLLKRQPAEVLVNLMTSFIRRFIKSPDLDTNRSFERTFGRYRPKLAALQGLSEEDLDDAIVDAYCKLVHETGSYPYVSSAIILDPEIDSTHYRLIYATRNLKGIEAFKQAEQSAMPIQEEVRAQIRGKKLDSKGPLLFPPASMGRPQHYDSLRDRYSQRARHAAVSMIKATPEVSYDDIFAAALAYPAVWESDIKRWVREWHLANQIELIGLKGGSRTPKHSCGIRLRRLKNIEA